MGNCFTTFCNWLHWNITRKLQLKSGEPSVTGAGVERPLGAADSFPWAAWVSVDPRGETARLDVYPRRTAWSIEAAWQRGDQMVDLGPGFFNAAVYFDADGFTQRTAHGLRDVRRVPLRCPDDPALVLVQRGRKSWRIVQAGAAVSDRDRVTVEVSARAAEGAVEVARVSADPSGATAFAAVAAAAPATRIGSDVLGAAASPAAEEAAQPLWEWCHVLGCKAGESSNLPSELWGVYSSEQNAEIEQAFQSGEAAVEVTVGVRDYHVSFGPEPGFARQVDVRLRKKRLVRRRLVGAAERELRLRPEAPVETRGQDTCVICCAEFSETAAMPTVEIPSCRHVFHQACIQQAADDGLPCPCCRGEVDWSAAMPSLRRRSGRHSRGRGR